MVKKKRKQKEQADKHDPIPKGENESIPFKTQKILKQ